MLEAPNAGLSGEDASQAQALFNAQNAAILPKTRELLDRIAGRPALQARLLNTLSMLEHLGSQKIMATRQGAAIDQATLRHLAEECQHAFFMKRKAEQAAGRTLEFRPGELLAPHSARGYFQRLEASVFRQLEREQSPDACYLYMSLIVELRAVWFYSLYQQSLDRQGWSLSLKRLLGEELNHLTEMAERLEQTGEFSEARIESFVRLEHALFGRLLDSLQLSAN